MTQPVSEEIAAVLSRLYDRRYDSPSHQELDEVFAAASCVDHDPKRLLPNDNVGKGRRVRSVVSAVAQGGSGDAPRLVEGLLARLRAFGAFDANSEHYGGDDLVEDAIRAFRGHGWSLDRSGRLAPMVIGDLPFSQQRPALNLLIERAQRAADDAPLLLGTAKELLESTSRYVLELTGIQARDNADFDELVYLARDRLSLLPQQAPPGSTEESLREVYDGLWKVARHINALRNAEGTGHGRNRLPATDERAARSMVRASAVLAGLMLDTADALYGERHAAT